MLYADVCVNTPLGAPRPVAAAGGPAPADNRLKIEDGRLGPQAPVPNSQSPVSSPQSLIPSPQSLASSSVFTYEVPAALAARVQPGHLVWVPFRGRRIQGVVLRLHDAAPDFQTRELISLVWAQPVLNDAQLALAGWISEYYLAPLIDSLRLMLPVGLSQRGQTVFRRTPAPAPAGLSAKQGELLARIAREPADWAEITAEVKRVTQRRDLEPLIEMGLVVRDVAFPSPPPRPKTDRRVRLIADAAAVAAALEGLGRKSKKGVALRWLAGHKAVLDLLAAHAEPLWIGRVYAETGATLQTLRDLEAAGLVTVAEEVIWRDPLAHHEFQLDLKPVLTDDQAAVWGTVAAAVAAGLKIEDGGLKMGDAGGRDVACYVSESAPLGTDPQSSDPQSPVASIQHPESSPQSPATDPQSPVPGSRAFLLHGVTGSGKTEIYLRAIEVCLAQGRQAVMLVPEIALTPQTIRRFAARFPGKVTVWHSEMSDGERFDVWRRVRTNHPAAQVVVGSRSALFLSYPQLGLIAVDEEHEPSYKQERTPRYHARTVALALGRATGATVLLGSATPALETYYAARRGELTLLTLPQRIKSELPPVTVVDMRQELRMGNRSMFSRRLSQGLQRVLANGEQAILYLNRRGAATFVLCRDCGYVATCAKCASPLTFHGEGDLVCHQCSRRYPAPVVCPECGSKRIRYFGAGTERVEEAVKLEFPTARTLRWDRDVTGAKGSHDAILTKFVKHEADVLIGTQMIAKGLDLPLVTLVGAIAADVGLFLPDFRASERTFQLLTQVAGRAGRSALGGEVVVQTYHPEHYAIQAASEHDYEGFYREEMAFRRQQAYPPLRRLARLVYHHGQRARVQADAEALAATLRGEIAAGGLADTDLIGPAPCFFARQRGEWRWQVVVRGPEPAALLRRVALGPGWRVDVDPVDLL